MRIVILILAAVLLVPGVANAYRSCGMLYLSCMYVDGEQADLESARAGGGCLGYGQATIELLNGKEFCVPDDWSAEDWVSLYRVWVKARLTAGSLPQKPGSYCLALALAEKFPCGR